MQTSSQQPSLREAPGGEMLASKSEGEPVRVGLELGQGLHPHTLSKAHLKKQRKLAKSQSQQQPQQPIQVPPSQHYKEKAPAQKEPTLAEGITKDSAFEQQTQHLSESEKQKQRLSAKESPILSSSSSTYQKPMETTTTTTPSLEPPLLSPAEKSRQLEARKEVEQLEEMERQDRIARAKREDVQALARREASLMGTVREEEAERMRIEEADKIDRREAESEASLMGTVIDEERERQRRIEEDYPTYTEPLEKTKALEEIERRRRVYSVAEKSRQQLAASSSAKLFPNAPRPHLAEAKLWTASGLLKRETPLPSMETKPRFGEFIATTTKTTTTHLPHTTVQSKQSSQPYSSTESEMRVGSGSGAGRVGAPQLKFVETSSFAAEGRGVEQMMAQSPTKVSKETYRSQSRPRLVVHHTGLSGKWQRHTETVELHEGVDY